MGKKSKLNTITLEMPEEDSYIYQEDDDLLLKEAQEELQKDKFTAVRAMIGAMLCNFCVGNYFLYGDYNDAVADWLRRKDRNLTPQSTLMVQPIWLLC